jgi:hypothetical protein
VSAEVAESREKREEIEKVIGDDIMRKSGDLMLDGNQEFVKAVGIAADGHRRNMKNHGPVMGPNEGNENR